MTHRIHSLNFYILTGISFGLVFFLMIQSSNGQRKPISEKWMNVDKIVAIRDGTIVTSSDIFILDKIASCSKQKLQSKVFKLQDDTDFFFLYLLTLSVYSEASSLYEVTNRDLMDFLEPVLSEKDTRKDDEKHKDTCSLSMINQKMAIPVAEYLLYTDLYLHHNFLMNEGETTDAFLTRYYKFSRDKIGKVQFVSDNFELDSTP
jgi:hypothetical protein